MKKINKEFLITTVVSLLPIIFGLCIYGKLPEEIPTKWYSDGTVGQYMPKAFTVFGMPVFMAVINGVTHFALNTDPKKQNIGTAMKILGKWICPIMSVILVPMCLLWGMGHEININKIVPSIVGILFVIIGNYLPKTRRSYTTGIRTPWTLNSDENWRKTHHLAAFLWILSGVIMIILGLIQGRFAFLAAMVLVLTMVLIPFAYSYILYRKGI